MRPCLPIAAQPADCAMDNVIEHARHTSPAPTPQALAWHGGDLWIGSRDLRRIYRMNTENWTVAEEIDPPGIPWAAVSIGDAIRFTLGEGPDDDRYIRTYTPVRGFSDERIECPDFTGSYLSFDGSHLYLSQWYKHRILQLDAGGSITRSIDVGEEISGHCFADGSLYVVRGHEAPSEEWKIARVDLTGPEPAVQDIARIPYASRSLAFDGKRFWSNHRPGGEVICFDLPK